MGRGCGRSEVHSRRSLNCYKQTVKGDSGESSERKGGGCRESLSFLRENQSVLEILGVSSPIANLEGKGLAVQNDFKGGVSA